MEVLPLFAPYLVERCCCGPANGSDLSSTPYSTPQVALTVPIENLGRNN